GPVADIVRKMMAKRPEDRYQTPAQVADALSPYAVPVYFDVGILLPVEGEDATALNPEKQTVVVNRDAASSTAFNHHRWGRQRWLSRGSRLRLIAGLAGLLIFAAGLVMAWYWARALPHSRLGSNLPHHEGIVHSIAFSPSGALLASAGADNT